MESRTPLGVAMARDPDLLDFGPQRQRIQRGTMHPYYTEAVVEAWLTQGARINHEVNYHRLSNTMKKKFDQAMKKEWLSWLAFNAVEVIDPADLPVKVNVVGSRWVHTDKNAKKRAGGTPCEVEAKSRLVVRGDQEQTSFKCDAPTASTLASNMLCYFVSALEVGRRS